MTETIQADAVVVPISSAASAIEQCGNCRFASINPDDVRAGNLNIRRCRRYPPSTTHFIGKNGQPSTFAEFTPVMRETWCGEYRRRTEMLA